MLYSEPGEPQIFGESIEFSKQNFSLLLKNVQKHQNGVYTAVVSSQEDKTIAKHHVTVLGKFLNSLNVRTRLAFS